ncbi:uncharacterized protein I303_100102 [Kwoniella dejecticola CBS 10117]|uniref:Dynein light intermediate chain 1, cytosolic n=1 Tax=Kwoniella dejecticola CBS 10117 TaxID=1296121 RepID=A0A1A6ADZ3_9TREE|nr:uncharacterized protein I303_00102 [Kwoniella dejecticola CBS 10117]OBR88291.1 hypothetical protein I303_00102 [Kwoniella dejecticola CBS 10117]
MNINASASASASATAGPSRPSPTTSTHRKAQSEGGGSGSLWTEILGSADRQKGLSRKNLIVLSERHHGRTHLLSQLNVSSKKRKSYKQSRNGKKGLAIGYEVIDISDGDEDSVPPLSVFYPPSSHPSLLRLISKALPPHPVSDTAVVIVLDWTKPSSMVQELLTWLSWIDEWSSSAAERGELDELKERLQSHVQHYSEPSPTPSASTASYAGAGALLPLAPGTLTLNSHGIPITVVCTKADLIDSVGEEVGMKGGGWEERTDWIQQVLRTICLAYGASLFYTAPTQPTTYSLLRSYLLHRLYTVPPTLSLTTTNTSTAQIDPTPTIHTASTRFPFPHRANVLDRDAVMVPSGWDSWGKVNVLREGFDPARIGTAFQNSLRRFKGEEDENEPEGETLEGIWEATIPLVERGSRPNNTAQSTIPETEQSFLSRQLDLLLKDPNRDPKASFRHAAATVVGPMSGAEGLNLPGVEKALGEMEGLEKGEELKEKFARLSRKDPSKNGPLSPTSPAPGGNAMPNEALHNFFQGLLANRSKGGTPSTTPAKSAEGK